MKLKILSWNVRGVNDRNKTKLIKALIRSQNVDLVCLQETKMTEMSLGVVRSLGVGRFLEGSFGCQWCNWRGGSIMG